MKRFLPVATVSAALLAGGAFAAPLDKKHSLTISRPTAVGASVLPVGTYRVEIGATSDTVRFVQGKATVAEASCKVGIERVVYRGDALHYRTIDGREQLTKIVFADSGLAIELAGTLIAGGEAPIAATAQQP